MSTEVDWQVYIQDANDRFILPLVRYAEANYDAEMTAYAAFDDEYLTIVEALDLAYQYGNWLEICSLVWRLCIDHNGYLFIRGHWHELETRLTQAIEAAEITQETALLDEFLSCRARLLLNKGELLTAQKEFSQILGKATTTNEHRIIAYASINLGIIHQLLGEYNVADIYYQKSLDQYKVLESRSGLSDIFFQMGRLAETSRDYQKAHNLYQDSLIIAQELNDLVSISTTLHQLGIIAQEMNHYDTARDLLLESLHLKKQLGHRPGVANSLAQLGVLAYKQERLDDAEDFYWQALSIWEALGGMIEVSIQLFNLAEIYERQGYFAQAVSLLEKAVAIAEQVGLPDRVEDRKALNRVRGKLAEKDDGGDN